MVNVMGNIKINMPMHQFKALQADIVDALLHAEMSPCCDYYVQHSDGSRSYTEGCGELFAICYDDAEGLLNDCGIWPDG
jgi:hypothetical protein